MGGRLDKLIDMETEYDRLVKECRDEPDFVAREALQKRMNKLAAEIEAYNGRKPEPDPPLKVGPWQPSHPLKGLLGSPPPTTTTPPPSGIPTRPGIGDWVPRTGPRVEALAQLCKGPVWDGDLISKSDRYQFQKIGWVECGYGFSFLTAKGVEVAFGLGFLKKG